MASSYVESPRASDRICCTWLHRPAQARVRPPPRASSKRAGAPMIASKSTSACSQTATTPMWKSDDICSRTLTCRTSSTSPDATSTCMRASVLPIDDLLPPRVPGPRSIRELGRDVSPPRRRSPRRSPRCPRRLLPTRPPCILRRRGGARRRTGEGTGGAPGDRRAARGRRRGPLAPAGRGGRLARLRSEGARPARRSPGGEPRRAAHRGRRRVGDVPGGAARAGPRRRLRDHGAGDRAPGRARPRRDPRAQRRLARAVARRRRRPGLRALRPRGARPARPPRRGLPARAARLRDRGRGGAPPRPRPGARGGPRRRRRAAPGAGAPRGGRAGAGGSAAVAGARGWVRGRGLPLLGRVVGGAARCARVRIGGRRRALGSGLRGGPLRRARLRSRGAAGGSGGGGGAGARARRRPRRGAGGAGRRGRGGRPGDRAVGDRSPGAPGRGAARRVGDLHDHGRGPGRGGAVGEPPAGFQAGPSDDPGDARVAPDPDARLPWLDEAAVRRWWAQRGADLPAGTRLLRGRPRRDEAWLARVLREGSQPARAAAAITLAIHRPGRPLFEVRAPARGQARALAALHAAP